MKLESKDFWRVTDIAAHSGVTLSAVGMWRTRHKDFPEPLFVLGNAPVFSKEEVLAWIQNRP